MAQALAVACLLVLAALVGSALHTVSLTPDPLAPPGSTAGPTVVIGTGGLRPQDLDPHRTPALWGLLRDGSSASLNITSVHPTTCPGDGWLTLSAGGRAALPDGAALPRCPALPAVESGRVSGWDAIARDAAARPYDAVPGRLAQELATQGQCISAIGPGAALAAALPGSGAVPRYQPYAVDTLTSGLAGCRTALVDVGSVQDDSLGDPGAPGGSRAAQVSAVDARVAEVVSAAPAAADILVVSLADGMVTPRLGVMLAAGPRFGPGALYSPSTRQTGLVQLEDVTATILADADVPVSPQVSGAALRRSPAASNSEELAQDRQSDLVDLDRSSSEVQPIVYPFFLTWAVAIVLAVTAVAVLWWRRLGTLRQREAARSGLRKGLVLAATVPAATFLANIVPWWRFVWPPVALVAAVGVWVAVLGAVALKGAWRLSPLGPVAAVAALTFGVLAVDVMNGSRLQLASLLGLNPIVGGRFFGTGNVTFALLLAATFLLAIAASGRLIRVGRPRVAATAVTLIGLVAVLVGAVPVWGSDVGGPPALIPGLAVLVLSILKVRLSWRRGLLIAGGTVGLTALLALADWLRPQESRSHLGRFVQTLLDGQAGSVIARKLGQNVDTLVGTTVFAYLVPVALLLLVYVAARPRSWAARPLRPLLDEVPTMHAGLVGVTLSLVIALLINDTGVAIPPVAFSLLLPLLGSAAIRLWELRSRAGRVQTRAELWHG